MEKYTIKLHVERISMMLALIKAGKKEIGSSCPAAYDLRYGSSRYWENYYHKICMDFVKVPQGKRSMYDAKMFCCPCWAFGDEEALTRTKAALEEYYKGGQNAKNNKSNA